MDEPVETRSNNKLRWLRLFAFVGVGLILFWIWQGEPGRPTEISAVYDTIKAEDISQHRLNTPAPTPNDTLIVTQTFVPQHDGLTEIELILARRTEPTADENGRFTIAVYDENNNLLVTRDLLTRNFSHNQTYNLADSHAS